MLIIYIKIFVIERNEKLNFLYSFNSIIISQFLVIKITRTTYIWQVVNDNWDYQFRLHRVQSLTKIDMGLIIPNYDTVINHVIILRTYYSISIDEICCFDYSKWPSLIPVSVPVQG